MRQKIVVILIVLVSWMVDSAYAQNLFKEPFIHQLGVELRPGYIAQSHDFFKGDNEKGEAVKNSFSAHLKYAFQFSPDSYISKLYGPGIYQGLGVAYYTFGEKKELGSPAMFYLFQGAPLARLSDRVSFNYEWNLGLSFGWHPYDYYENSYNKVIGSKANAYINLGFYLNWMLSRHIDLTTGVALTHFSNGNTSYPNAGLNTIGLKVGLAYNFNRTSNSIPKRTESYTSDFKRHISYDVLLFGAWRKTGVFDGHEQILSPHTYGVMGFNFAPMYNFGYKFRAGVSLDGVYDRSANVYVEDYIIGTEPPVSRPSFAKQTSLGLSARAEFIMPFFTIGAGLGANILHASGDLKTVYQILALKINITRDSYLHIGYSLHDFHDPNFLMLGVGYRFGKR